MDEIGNWFNKLPFCTKFLVSNVVIITVALTMWPHNHIINELEKFQLWRHYSSFFLFPFGISGAIELYLLYYFSKDLETTKFSRATADYVYYLLFIISMITVSFDIMAKYLPFIFLLLDVLYVLYIPYDVVAGIIAGHLYFYLKERYPASSGIQLLNTPRWLYEMFPNSYRSSNTSKPTINIDLRVTHVIWDIVALLSLL
ncbi:14079_t:CDS:2, partial [Cetraspora pellucida]